MNQDMKPQFLSLAEDLHIYILTFLPYQDILHCTSVSIVLLITPNTPKWIWSFMLKVILQVCRGLHQIYLSSSELQYIVELGGQQLLPVGVGPGAHIVDISTKHRYICGVDT